MLSTVRRRTISGNGKKKAATPALLLFNTVKGIGTIENKDLANDAPVVQKVVLDTPEKVIHTIGGTDGLYLAVKGDEAKASEILSAIPEIATIRPERAPEEGAYAASIFPKEGADIRERLFRDFAAKDMPILEMRSETKTLEEVFITLTGEEGTC